MRQLSHQILKHRYVVLIAFLIAAAVSVFLSKGVGVNYQLMDYLPEDSPSTVALETMNDAFDSSIPNLRVMVSGVGIPEALEQKRRISEVDGVKEITWLDDAADLSVPMEMMDPDTLSSWYREDSALYSIRLDAEDLGASLAAIRDIVGDSGAMAGDAVNINAANQTTGSEVGAIMGYTIPLILVILLLTTSSWFEPLLFLASIGVAILINSGTNIFFGEISFITMATASILQLAVSMDYSIFLLHRFAEYREQGLPVWEAMTKAMTKSFSSILGSGLTTILGFTALLFMRFKLGPDMGLVLAKGIVLSMLSVMFLLPVLTVLSYKLIDRTHHRSFLPSFKGFGRLVPKLFIPVVLVVVISIVPAYIAQNNNTFLYGSSSMASDENSREYKEEQQIDELFGKSNQLVLMVPAGDPVAEKALSRELLLMPEVTSVVSYGESVGASVPYEFVPEDSLSELISGGWSRMILTVNTSQESDQAFSAVEEIRTLSGSYFGDNYHFAGGSVNVYDMKETVVADNKVVNAVSLLSIGLVILLLFRSVSIPFILLLTIETSIWINLSVPYFMGSGMAYIGFMIISSVQLGSTVDYAILFANRYIENRSGLLRTEAIRKTVADTTASILTSALILTSAGLILGMISTNGMVGEFGYLIGRGAALSAFMVLFFLPALLWLCDPILPKTTLGLKFMKPEGKD